MHFSLFIGPEKWPELFPMASGHRQSPVNISRESTTRGRSFKVPLTWRYVPENTKSLNNPGYSWRVDVNGEGSSLSGGPLMTDAFQLEQFHCHVSKTKLLIHFFFWRKINSFIFFYHIPFDFITFCFTVGMFRWQR